MKLHQACLPYISYWFPPTFTEKTVTTMNATELVAYPVQILWFTFYNSYHKWFVINGFTRVGFLSVDLIDCGDEVYMVEFFLSIEN